MKSWHKHNIKRTNQLVMIDCEPKPFPCVEAVMDVCTERLKQVLNDSTASSFCPSIGDRCPLVIGSMADRLSLSPDGKGKKKQKKRKLFPPA